MAEKPGLLIEMQAPSGVSASAVAGGTLADGTYYYKVTALDNIGETKGSSEVSATTSSAAGNQSVKVSWTSTPGASKYRVYGRATGAQDRYWETTSTSLTDNGFKTTGEVIGTGDGTTTSFSGTLANPPAFPNSVSIHYVIGATSYTATDDGAGNISGTYVSGTITYSTGVWSLTFTTAPDSGTNITADYETAYSGTVPTSTSAYIIRVINDWDTSLLGRVGIGTTAPGLTKLRVVSASDEVFKADDGATPMIKAKADGTVTFEKGNVGIGTAAPKAKLHINDTSANPGIRLTSAARTANITLDDTNNWVNFDVRVNSSSFRTGRIDSWGGNLILSLGGTLTLKGAGWATYATISGDVTDTASAVAYNLGTLTNLTTSGAKLLKLSNSGSEKFYIDKDGGSYFAGDVGIGTVSPGAKLEVVGDVKATGANHTFGGAAPAAGVGLAYAGDPGLLDFVSGSAIDYIGLGGTPERAGTAGRAYGIRAQVRPSSTQTYAAQVLADSNYGNITNLTQILSGTRTIPSGNYGIYEASGYQSYFSSNVGIGTTAPGALLHVYRATTEATPIGYFEEAGLTPGETSLVRIRRPNNLSTPAATEASLYIADHSSNFPLHIEDQAGTALFTVKGDGNIGIGTVSPQDPLHIFSGTTDLLRIQNPTGGLGNQAGIKFVTFDTLGSACAGIFAEDEGSWNGALVFKTDNDDTDNDNLQERMRITKDGNVGIGTTSPGGSTTVGTKVLSIADGTAPAGGVTGQISLYSSGGELYVLDAAGNATLLSPHDKETNEWIFFSYNTKTGRVLRVNMEELVREVEKLSGKKFLFEGKEIQDGSTILVHQG